jgi:hypothetical protein
MRVGMSRWTRIFSKWIVGTGCRCWRTWEQGALSPGVIRGGDRMGDTDDLEESGEESVEASP